ncbi:hypothetical protein BC938DRAFT_479187 [Jimgerdemannia flammicorona]|uniref:F-box domain-containing protein n=1 Tax=Jimgerdemannia flammicorona TaxID=994334 RepID=A0A433QLF5_9FUNG|nr:hypothetical protein BC938DRAFT_479187 [Jimgerdemannia flammicorona]
MQLLPTELLSSILAYLTRKTLAHVSLTSRRLFLVARPHLYTHIRLSVRRHVKNLEHYCRVDPGLVDTLRNHVRRITFSCRHSEAQWLLTEARFLFRHTKRLEHIEFNGFQGLKVEHVIELAPLVPPSVVSIELSYCNLDIDRSPPHAAGTGIGAPRVFIPGPAPTISTDPSDPSIPVPRNPPPVFANVTKLTFVWTDFLPPAIGKLLRRLPNLRAVSWRPNHNRVYNANDSAILPLLEYCPRITSLDISLQEVREDSVRAAIIKYATQLRELRVRCGPTNSVLQAIAAHATSLERLELFATEVVRCEAEDVLRVLARCPQLKRCRVAGFPYFGRGIPSEVVEVGWVSVGPGTQQKVPGMVVASTVTANGRRPAVGEGQKMIELREEGIERIHRVLIETRKDLLEVEEDP